MNLIRNISKLAKELRHLLFRALDCAPLVSVSADSESARNSHLDAPVSRQNGLPWLRPSVKTLPVSSRPAPIKMDVALQRIADKDISVKKAAKELGIPCSRLQRAYNRRQNPAIVIRGRPPVFSEKEEAVLAETLTLFGSLGRPLDGGELREAAGIFIKTLSWARQDEVSRAFKGKDPGRKWMRKFLKRHEKELGFKTSNRLEACRRKACAAESMMRHYAQISSLIEKNSIDPSRIFNLDESGASPKELAGMKSKAIYPLSATNEVTDAAFSPEVERFTCMPVVSADGRLHSPLIALPGKRSRWRKVKINGKVSHQAPRDFLPHGSTVMQRAPAGVNTAIFLEWLPVLLSEAKHLRNGGKRMLVTHDGFKSHVSLSVVKLMSDEGALARALPSHSSHKAQPLDVSAFGPLKARLKQEARAAMRAGAPATHICQACAAFTRACDQTLSPANIKSGFRASCARPIDLERCFSKPLPRSEEDPTPVTAEGLRDLFIKHKREQRNISVTEVVELKRGALGASHGLAVTTSEVIEKLTTAGDHRRKKHAEKQERAERREQDKVLKPLRKEREKRNKEGRALQKKWITKERNTRKAHAALSLKAKSAEMKLKKEGRGSLTKRELQLLSRAV